MKKLSIIIFIFLITIFVMNCDNPTEPKIIPPQVISVTPENHAQNISVDTTITIQFSKKIDTTTIPKGFSLTCDGIDPSLKETSGSKKVFLIYEKLKYGTIYTAKVNKNIEDEDGNNLQEEHSWNFTTVETPDTTGPKIIFTNPENHEHSVSINLKEITITFNEPVNINTDDVIFQVVADSSSTGVMRDGEEICFYDYDTLETDISVFEDGLTITLLNDLEYKTRYRVDLDSSITDVAGNDFIAEIPEYVEIENEEDARYYWHVYSHLNFFTEHDPNLWKLPENYIISQIAAIDWKIYVVGWSYEHWSNDCYDISNAFSIFNSQGEMIKNRGPRITWTLSESKDNTSSSIRVATQGIDAIYISEEGWNTYKTDMGGNVQWIGSYGSGRDIETDNYTGVFGLRPNRYISKLDNESGATTGFLSLGDYNVTNMCLFNDYVITFGFYNGKLTLGKAKKTLDRFIGVMELSGSCSRMESAQNGELIYFLSEETDSLDLSKQTENGISTEWQITIPLDNVTTTSKDAEGNLYLIDKKSDYELIKVSRNDGSIIFQTSIKEPYPTIPDLVDWRLPHKIRTDVIYVPWGHRILRFDTETGQRITN